MLDGRAGPASGDVGARNLINGVAPDLPNRFDLQSKSVHVALSQVSAAGVERHLAAGRDQVFQLEKLVALLRCAEAVLDDSHHHADGEVLVALHYIDIAGADLRHLV